MLNIQSVFECRFLWNIFFWFRFYLCFKYICSPYMWFVVIFIYPENMQSSKKEAKNIKYWIHLILFSMFKNHWKSIFEFWRARYILVWHFEMNYTVFMIKESSNTQKHFSDVWNMKCSSVRCKVNYFTTVCLLSRE